MKNITIKIPYRATIIMEPTSLGDIELEIENDKNQLPLALLNSLIDVKFNDGDLGEFFESKKDEILEWLEGAE